MLNKLCPWLSLRLANNRHMQSVNNIWNLMPSASRSWHWEVCWRPFLAFLAKNPDPLVKDVMGSDDLMVVLMWLMKTFGSILSVWRKTLGSFMLKY